LKRALEFLREGEKKTAIPKEISRLPERQAIKLIFQAAEQKDKFAIRIFREAGQYLGLSIANIVNYMDPEMIILTGYTIEEDPGIFLKIVQEEYRKLAFGNELRKVSIVKSILGEDVFLIGTATLAYQNIFSLMM